MWRKEGQPPTHHSIAALVENVRPVEFREESDAQIPRADAFADPFLRRARAERKIGRDIRIGSSAR